MITAESITDEQIRELQRDIAGFVFPASGMAHTGMSEAHEACEDALTIPNDPNWPAARMSRRNARARCAEILNARTPGKREAGR